MSDSDSIRRVDEGEPPEPIEPPELPPTPELPEVPEVQFERPNLAPSRAPRVLEASRGMALAFSVGFALTGPIILGALLGLWLDRVLHTTPWLTVGLLLLGIVAGFTQMIRTLNRLQEEQERKP